MADNVEEPILKATKMFDYQILCRIPLHGVVKVSIKIKA